MVRTRYDDGGFSGGSTDRPALQRLLADVKARRVNVIVVYKVDRLTRSLADFAKLVELFDAHGVSFVSVTQQFNTTTSMGRLTLNVLLSFAQFEREVTSERIRDKVAASKRKGLWVGGMVPLGYELKDGKLLIVEEEAEQVRTIFRRYLELGSVNRLVVDLRSSEASGPRSGSCRTARTRGGVCLHARAALSTCCATASISARSGTRTRSAPVRSRRCWIAICLKRPGEADRAMVAPDRDPNQIGCLLAGLAVRRCRATDGRDPRDQEPGALPILRVATKSSRARQSRLRLCRPCSRHGYRGGGARRLQ